MNVLIPVLLPLITALLIQLLGRFASNNVRDGVHTLMAVVTFTLFASWCLRSWRVGARALILQCCSRGSTWF